MKELWWKIRVNIKNYSFKSTLTWIVSHTIFIGTLILGGLHGKQWATNIFSFMCVATVIFRVIGAFLPNESIKNDKRAAPDILVQIIELGIVLITVSFGWFVFASIYLISEFFVGIKWHRVDLLNKPAPDVIEAEFIDVSDETKELK